MEGAPGMGRFIMPPMAVIAVLDEGVVHAHAWYVFELPVEELRVEGL
jgi:hypothetical protein